MARRVKSQKGNDLIVDSEEFCYRKDYLNKDGTSSWRCCKTACRGRIKLDMNDNILSLSGVHHHPPDVVENRCRVFNEIIRDRAKTTVEKPRTIIQTASCGITDEVASAVPDYLASQRRIQRTRRKAGVLFPTPQCVQDVVIPESLVRTANNDNFVLWDSGAGDENRTFIFGTEDNLRLLQEFKHWFVDGTFKISPGLYFQVWTIHALVDGKALPLLYILLRDKSQQSYTRVLRRLVELEPNLCPDSIMADFEKACLNALEDLFPRTTIKGCLFHLGQCLWRKVQELGFTNSYREDDNNRKCIKMLLALSFVPQNDVQNVFTEIVAYFPENLTPLLDYWEDNYIGRLRRLNRRSQPFFPIRLWNMYDRVINNLPRTNNSVEGWHHAFQNTLDCHHPSIYKLLQYLHNEQQHNRILVQRYRDGHRRPESSKNKYIKLTRRLRTVVGQYGTIANLDYLRAIAHNLSIN